MNHENPKHALFISSLIFLALSICFILFSFYLLPYLVWHLHYDVPEFIADLTEQLRSKYSFSEAAAHSVIFLLFFMMGLISGLIASKMHKSLEQAALFNTVNNSEENVRVPTERNYEALRLISLLIIGSLFVYLLVYILHWLVSSQPLGGEQL